MTSSRRLALAKFLKKAKSTKEGGDAVASDVPTVASLPIPSPPASPSPIAAVPLAMASTKDELDAAWGQKLRENEGALTAKAEALSLLQAEANKLRVEKEFLEKQLTSKDSRITELEGEVQELTGEMAGAFEEGFQEALAQASCENTGINISNCDPTHHVVDGKVVPMDLED